MYESHSGQKHYSGRLQARTIIKIPAKPKFAPSWRSTKNSNMLHYDTEKTRNIALKLQSACFCTGMLPYLEMVQTLRIVVSTNIRQSVAIVANTPWIYTNVKMSVLQLTLHYDTCIGSNYIQVLFTPWCAAMCHVCPVWMKLSCEQT
jgi:hypothetical protein